MFVLANVARESPYHRQSFIGSPGFEQVRALLSQQMRYEAPGQRTSLKNPRKYNRQTSTQVCSCLFAGNDISYRLLQVDAFIPPACTLVRYLALVDVYALLSLYKDMTANGHLPNLDATMPTTIISCQ